MSQAGPIPIAFGLHPSWRDLILSGLDARYAPSFVNLAQTPLDGFAAIFPL